MLPFKVTFTPGLSVHEQVLFAAKKAIVCGQLKPGDAFPSVRVLSQELRINPNTAQKVSARLRDEGLIEMQPGLGSVVAKSAHVLSSHKKELLGRDLEHLVVEAKKLKLTEQELLDALRQHWKNLS